MTLISTHNKKSNFGVKIPPMIYFDDIYIAVFNTRKKLIEQAATEFIEKYGQEHFDAKIKPALDAGVMSFFKVAPTLQTETFVFRLAEITEDFFASGAANAEGKQERQINRTTKDGCLIDELRVVYYVNQYDERIDEYKTASLFIDGDGDVRRKDGKKFDELASRTYTLNLFGSLSAAQERFKESLEWAVDFYRREIATAEKRLAEIERKQQRLEQDMATYLKPSSDKKPEKVGNVRI